MKNRQIWLVIVCILIVGASVTFYTNSFGSREMGAALEETSAAQETSAGIAMARIAAAEEEAPPSQEETGAAREALLDAATADSASLEEERPRSPASPLEGTAGWQEGAAESSAADYRRRLEELDRQISQLEEEGAGANVYSAQTSVASELKLWESEMNNIYNGLLAELPKDQAAGLAEEQQKWLKERDIKAAGGDGNSSSPKGIEYTNVQVELTRLRAYELAGRYENLHNEEMNQKEAEAGREG